MRIAPRDPDRVIPLTPHMFYILLALANGQDNGYGVMSTVARDSNEVIRLTAGTTYPLLRRLTVLGYIKLVGENPASGPTGVSRVYRLTDTGRLVLGWEANRYRAAADLWRTRTQ